MVRVKTLGPPQTYILKIFPKKHPSQSRTLKLNMNPCNNYHRDRVTTLQPLRSTILLSKLFSKANLVIIEAATTIYTLILTLMTQKFTDIDVCKIYSSPFPWAILIFYFYFFAQTSFKYLFFLCLRANLYKY